MKINKSIFSLFICVLMLCTVCFTSYAKTLYPVGDWNFEKINNDTEFEVDSYTGSSANLSVPYYINGLPVTSIGSNAFLGNTTMTSISMPGLVTTINYQAFINCSNLATVSLNPDVSFIGNSAFSGCTSLSSINIDETSVTSIGSSCFMNCDSLTQVELPGTVTTISSMAFSYMDNLNKIVIPRSVTDIDEKAFYNSNNVVIYCYRDSYAHNYASDMIIDYVIIDDVQPTDTPTSPVQESYVLGDADGDGRVTIMDATNIQRLLAMLKDDPDGRIAVRGDVDFCGITILDATHIQRYLAEYPNTYNIGSTCYYD